MMRMRLDALLVGWSALAAALLALAACGEAPSGPRDHARVAVSAAPLRLPGISDVEYTVTVRNDAGDTVWSKAVSSSQYGDGAGAFSYVGSCDAASNPNQVQLVIDRLDDSDGATVGRVLAVGRIRGQVPLDGACRSPIAWAWRSA